MQRNGAPADGRNKWVSLGFRHTLYNWSYGYLWTGRGRSCGCERKTKICLSQNITNPVQKNINVLKYLKKRQWFLGNLIPLSGQIMRIYIYILCLYYSYTRSISGERNLQKNWVTCSWVSCPHLHNPTTRLNGLKGSLWWLVIRSCPPNRPPSEIKVLFRLLRRGGEGGGGRLTSDSPCTWS